MGHGAEGGGVFCVSLYFLMMIELCIAIYLLLHIGEGFVWRLKSCVNGGPGDNKAQGLSYVIMGLQVQVMSNILLILLI